MTQRTRYHRRRSFFERLEDLLPLDGYVAAVVDELVEDSGPTFAYSLNADQQQGLEKLIAGNKDSGATFYDTPEANRSAVQDIFANIGLSPTALEIEALLPFAQGKQADFAELVFAANLTILSPPNSPESIALGVIYEEMSAESPTALFPLTPKQQEQWNKLIVGNDNSGATFYPTPEENRAAIADIFRNVVGQAPTPDETETLLPFAVGKQADFARQLPKLAANLPSLAFEEQPTPPPPGIHRAYNLELESLAERQSLLRLGSFILDYAFWDKLRGVHVYSEPGTHYKLFPGGAVEIVQGLIPRGQCGMSFSSLFAQPTEGIPGGVITPGDIYVEQFAILPIPGMTIQAVVRSVHNPVTKVDVNATSDELFILYPGDLVERRKHGAQPGVAVPITQFGPTPEELGIAVATARVTPYAGLEYIGSHYTNSAGILRVAKPGNAFYQHPKTRVIVERPDMGQAASLPSTSPSILAARERESQLTSRQPTNSHNDHASPVNRTADVKDRRDLRQQMRAVERLQREGASGHHTFQLKERTRNQLVVLIHGKNAQTGDGDGTPNDDTDDPGMDEVYKLLRPHVAGGHILRLRSGNSLSDSEWAFIEAKQTITNTITLLTSLGMPIESLVLAGHSWGGGMAKRIAVWFNDTYPNIEIAGLAYVDAVLHGAGAPEFAFPANVKSILNIYQSSNSTFEFSGGSISNPGLPGFDETAYYGRYREYNVDANAASASTHTEIDYEQADEVADFILHVLDEWYRDKYTVP